jgi:hypothetical protein
MAFPESFNKTIHFVASVHRFYLLTCVVYMRKCFDVDRIDLKILTDVLMKTKEWFLKCPSLSACMWLSLVLEWLDGLHSCSIFNSLSSINRCSLNENILAPKTGTLQVSPKQKVLILLKVNPTCFYYISVIYGDHHSKWKSIYSKISVRALGDQMPSVNFLEDGVTSR